MERVRRWFRANAGHVTDVFLPDGNAEPVYPGAGYVRVWLAEGFLATAKSWGADQYPALYGSVSFPVPGAGPGRYTTLTRPPLAPGAHHDFPITPLLPYHGGVIEVDAAVYRVATDSPLVTVLQLIGALEPLLGPPLDVAAAIAARLGDGIAAVLDAHQQEPLLALHHSLVASDGGGTTVRSCHCVVLGSEREALAGAPAISGGRLVLRTSSGDQRPAGTDYLVLRVECRTERDDWNLPYLDTLIAASAEAYLTGQENRFGSLRKEAIIRAYNSPDLVPADRVRVAKLVKDRIDEVQQLGIVPGGRAGTLAEVAPDRLVSPDDPGLAGLTLDGLLR